MELEGQGAVGPDFHFHKNPARQSLMLTAYTSYFHHAVIIASMIHPSCYELIMLLGTVTS